MTVLANAKWELFAQALAKGETADAAYIEAGYTPNRRNASRLKSNEDIGARVAEILSRAAAKTEVTVVGITERLLAIAVKGESGTDAPMLSVGRAALMDVAKLNGLIIDKNETEHKGGLTIAQVERRIVDPRDRHSEGVSAAPGAEPV